MSIKPEMPQQMLEPAHMETDAAEKFRNVC